MVLLCSYFGMRKKRYISVQLAAKFMNIVGKYKPWLQPICFLVNYRLVKWYCFCFLCTILIIHQNKAKLKLKHAENGLLKPFQCSIGSKVALLKNMEVKKRFINWFGIPERSHASSIS